MPQKAVSEVYNSQLGQWVEITATTLPWSSDTDACLITCMDITKYKNENLRHILQLESLAYVDELTGARNYYKFKEDAQRILEDSKNLCHCLIKLDVENFKLVNQIYGYEKGNEILCSIANVIGQTTRNEYEIFARVGNDEFIALFTIADKAEIAVLYDTFLTKFYQSVGSKITFKFNFPHGRFIIYPSQCEKIDIMDLFEKVNIAHKKAKLNKTTEFVFYSENMTREALREKEIEDKMENALLNNEFQIYLQPKYYISDETIGGAEALARWKRDGLDVFFPSAFIPIFERNGFITKFDMYMLCKVCSAMQDWTKNGLPPVVVSVNFSRLHLSNLNFVKDLCQIVDEYGVARELIEIEITETAIYDNIDVLETILSDLHAAGFTMSMDDFGSGYSSLSMLKDLPVDVIKMDRSFFANQKDAERSKTVVGSIIDMAALLGIRIVAEGVEEQEQIDLLRELHCDMVQGYYYAKPMPVENFIELISTQQNAKEIEK